jgi:hypothetical protein
MNGKDCRVTRREIEEAELTQRLSGEALTHLASCAPCSKFREERTRLRELVGSLEPVVAPADFDMRLRARMADERHSHARQPFIFRFVMSTPAIAVAALLVVLTGSIVWIAQRNGNHLPTQAPIIASGPSAPVKETPTAPQESSVAINKGGAITAAGPAPTPTSSKSKPTGRSNYSRLNASKSVLARQTGYQTTDFNVSGAESIKQGEQRPGEVSLSAPVKPMVVSMRDDNGATRKISLPPVSFGSQRMVDNRIAVSTTNSRVW